MRKQFNLLLSLQPTKTRFDETVFFIKITCNCSNNGKKGGYKHEIRFYKCKGI